MKKLLIHQILDEISILENDYKELKNHQAYLQFYSSLMYFALKENKTLDEIHNYVIESIGTAKVLKYISWENRDKVFKIQSIGAIMEVKTGVDINTVEKLVEAIKEYESKI